MIDLESTILAQYANSPVILRLIQNMNAYIDPAANLDDFYAKVWNVTTAQGYGLDVWGRIVGVSRTVPVPAYTSLGFREAGYKAPFGPGGGAPLYDGSGNTALYRLNDESYRSLILAKALANISICSAPALNQMLQGLFGPDAAYVSDLGNMSMLITFKNLSLLDYYIILNSKVLPRPTGVLAYLYNGYVPGQTFLFRETGHGTPFGTGVLFAGQFNMIAY